LEAKTVTKATLAAGCPRFEERAPGRGGDYQSRIAGRLVGYEIWFGRENKERDHLF